MIVGSTPPTPASNPRAPRKAAGQAAPPIDRAQIGTAPGGDPAYRPGEVLVRLQPGTEQAAPLPGKVVEEFLLPGAHLDAHLDEVRIVRLSLPGSLPVEQAIEDLKRDPRVVYAEPNHVYTLEETERVPDDLDSRLWGLRAVSAPAAWAMTTGSRQGPAVAILDTGMDLEHPDLRNNLWINPGEIPGNGVDDDGNGVVDDVHGFDAFHQTGLPSDDHYHGTHVAGTIGAEGNNGQGVVGVNWQARLMPVKIFDAQGRTDAATIIRGMNYASRMGARVTNNSWGGTQFNQAIRDAFAASPALHVCAAGNSRKDTDEVPHYPSGYDLPNILSVAATDRNDKLASFSNYGGESVDIAAPGVDIYSTAPGGSFRTLSGTSMAAPHVTGAAGLLATAFPQDDAPTLKHRLLAAADRVGDLEGRVATGGRLNVAAPLEDDRVAPGEIRGLSGRPLGSARVRVEWRAPGDDGDDGRAHSYEVRWSDRPIGGPKGVPFSEATLVPGAPHPGEPGSLEKMEWDVFPVSHERDLYVGVRASDNAGLTSPIATARVTLPPTHVVFDGTDFTAEGTWTRLERDGRTVWSDSPDGDYSNNTSMGLFSRPISLKGVDNAKLVFQARYDLEEGTDVVWIQASRNGREWSPVGSLTGQSPWSDHVVPLSQYDGKTIQIRFQLVTDQIGTADGIELSRIAVVGDR